MLINDFFWIKSCKHDEEKRTINAEIEINKNHKIYSGHFPGTPVTPGVCLLQIVSDILSFAHKKDYQLFSSNVLKFITMLTPDLFQVVDVSIDYTLENQIVRVTGLINKDNVVFFKLKGDYKLNELEQCSY